MFIGLKKYIEALTVSFSQKLHKYILLFFYNFYFIFNIKICSGFGNKIESIPENLKSSQLIDQFISCSLPNQSDCTVPNENNQSLFILKNSSLQPVTSLDASSLCCPLACEETSYYSFTFVAALCLAILSSVGHRGGSSLVNASVLGYLDDAGKKDQLGRQVMWAGIGGAGMIAAVGVLKGFKGFKKFLNKYELY